MPAGASSSRSKAATLALPFPPPVYTGTGRPSPRARAASESSSAPTLPPGSRSRSGHTSTAMPRPSIDSSHTHLDPDAKSVDSDVDVKSEYRRWGHSAGGDKGQPPPYVGPPSYNHVHNHTAVPDEEQAQEARTLPMYMFVLGFVCPVLWLIGAFTLRAPHAHRAGVFDPYASLNGAEKAEAEREAEREMRRWEVETRWGKRCMWAAVVFVFLGLAVGMAAWGAIASDDEGALAA